MASVLSKDVSLYRQFHDKYGERYRTVREYFQPRQDVVQIEDVSAWLGGLVLAEPDGVDTGV